MKITSSHENYNGNIFTRLNTQEYDEIRFIITCSEWHKEIPTRLFALIIGGENAS